MLSSSLKNSNLKIIQLKVPDKPKELGTLFKRANCYDSHLSGDYHQPFAFPTNTTNFGF